jgi:hypothetical protein
MGFITSVFYFAFLFLVISSVWKIFTKAGEPGWACLVPFYNWYVLCKISDTKNWWLIFIPFANIYIAVVAAVRLAKSFGKDTGFGVGLLLLGVIFYPILGYGDARYIGPNGVSDSKEAFLDSIGTQL